LLTDPKSLSPAPTLEAILTSRPEIASATILASSMIFFSLKALCFKGKENH